ncbi:MAG TPA: hypothetical protein VJ717_13935 [Gemmatimonadaceae bacterium]|nr:hypothetical protein [Gemmatimonadaceae bacterium]
MDRYLDASGRSGVKAYELLPDGIKVQFSGGPTYLYTYASAGRTCIEQMKEAAREGRGLATYISRYVRGRYATRLA